MPLSEIVALVREQLEDDVLHELLCGRILKAGKLTDDSFVICRGSMLYKCALEEGDVLADQLGGDLTHHCDEMVHLGHQSE